MASKQNQGVLVSLIVFIVLTLAFGVATYFGAKGYQEQKAALATARSERTSAIQERDSLKADLDAFKTKLGYGSAAADVIVNGKDGKENVTVIENGAEVEKPVHYNGMQDDLVAALGSAATETLTFKDGVAKLTAQIAAVNKQIADCAAERDANIKDAQASIASSAKEKTRFETSVAKKTADSVAGLADVRSQYADLTKQFDEQTKEFDTQKRNAKEAIDIAQAETEKERAAADNFAEINLELARRIDLLTNNDFETADANVISTDQVGKFVRLSVGSADGIRPLTKFNVFPKEALVKGGVKAKASVQVTHSLEEHVCEAKIIEDDQNNPIEPGDIVFTPLWRPGDVNKYALDYRLDINEDGVSDLGELCNMIAISGGEVVAYIDDNGEVHGKISPDTFRLVVSDETIVDRIAKAGDLSEAAKAQIEQDEVDFVASASENGVRTIRLADLLVQIGYKKTAALNRDKAEKAAGERQAAVSNTVVGDRSVIPVFESQSETKPGSVLPVYEEGADKKDAAANATFRKRTPKN